MNKLVHWEIPSTDIGKSREFYAELFGWEMQQWSPEYVLFSSGKEEGGGIALVDAVPAPCISVYIGVEDIPGTLGKVVRLGGKQVREKSEIGGGMGFIATFEDPCGVHIGLWSKE